MSKSGDFLKNSTIYLVGSTMTKLITFLMLPLYTAILLPEDFGIYNLSISVLSVLVPFFGLEIWVGTMRFMLEKNGEKRKEKTIFSSFLIFLMSCVLFTLLYVIARIFFNIPYLGYIYILALAQGLNSIYMSIARGYDKNMLYAATGLICSIVTLSSNVLLITVVHLGVTSLYISTILGLLVQIICIEIKVKVLSRFSIKYFDKVFFKEIVLFSLPLSLNTVCYFFAGNYNSVVISAKLGLSETGYYSVAGKFANMLPLVVSCFSMAIQEMIYKVNSDSDKIKFYSKAINYYFKLVFIAVLVAIPAVKIVFPFFVNSAYIPSLTLVPMYFLATAVCNYSGYIGNYFLSEKITKPLTWSILSAGLVNFVFIHLLIEPLGVQAASISLFIAFSISIALRIFLLNRHIPIFFDLRFIIVFIGLFCFTLLVFYKFGILINLLWCLVMALVFLIYFKAPILGVITLVYGKVLDMIKKK